MPTVRSQITKGSRVVTMLITRGGLESGEGARSCRVHRAFCYERYTCCSRASERSERASLHSRRSRNKGESGKMSSPVYNIEGSARKMKYLFLFS